MNSEPAKPDRRGFLQSAGALGAAAALGAAGEPPLGLTDVGPDRIPRKPFGRTGEHVSVIGLGGYGQLCVLVMGEPIRIAEFAAHLITLAGLIPGRDIQIVYTGLRPAEKLFEELLIGNNASGTDHPMIMRAIEHHLPWARMQQMLNEQLVALASFDCHRALALLAESSARLQLIVLTCRPDYYRGLESARYVQLAEPPPPPRSAPPPLALFE